MSTRLNRDYNHPMPGTVIPAQTLESNRTQDVSTPYKLRKARSLVAYSVSSQSYINGWGLALDRKLAKDLVKLDQDRVDRLLGIGEAPRTIAYLLLRQLSSLSITTRKKYMKAASLLREHGWS